MQSYLEGRERLEQPKLFWKSFQAIIVEGELIEIN